MEKRSSSTDEHERATGCRKKSRIAYKLISLRANGTLGPLFINRRMIIPIGKWLQAECFPTKGFAVRTGWHTMLTPNAPHLSPNGRVWAEVEIREFTTFQRPVSQGGKWCLAKWMKVRRVFPEDSTSPPANSISPETC